MDRVTTTITVINHIDEILAERGFIPRDEIRSLTLENVLVDTGATQLCLPEEAIAGLGLTRLTLAGEIEVKTAMGTKKSRVFENARLSVAGREGRYDCWELPAGEDPLLGLIPLEALGLEPDLQNQRLKLLPNRGQQNYLRI